MCNQNIISNKFDLNLTTTLSSYECHYAECRHAECGHAECAHVECHYAERRNAECHYTDETFFSYKI